MKVLAIVQARMGSTRFPNKVMQLIEGKPLIGLLLDRLLLSKKIEQVVVATSVDSKNDTLVSFLNQKGISYFRGNENDVLDRYYQAALLNKADVIVRITGDCPLVDPNLVDEVIELFFSKTYDYVSNIDPPTFPDGLDIEVFSFFALEKAYHLATKTFDREHVTPFLRESKEFLKTNLSFSKDYSSQRWTVDEKNDLDVIQNIFGHFSPRIDFGWKEVILLYESKPEIFQLNRHLKRNEGSSMGTGQKLWKKAKTLIPGGNMLLSKRAEMFLPELWPAYFSKAKGCEVWDLDGNRYTDMFLMGIGTNTLGYGHPEVDRAVLETVANGNMSTFNCPEEVQLAEKLVELHPWADMVRLARTGGEANAIAIRIARAATGKEKVAICGYHGWHDWYLSANLASDDSLSGHLLPGLDPNGVPKNLKGTVFPFLYNRLDELEKLVKEEGIGVIMMEVSRNTGPDAGFLEGLRKIATDNGIVLIFDECTSGFRQTFGGLHKLYGVEPDMAIFGKTLGNGYAITAVIGKRDVMETAQSTFISSTFWTERIGPSAAIKTLEVMNQLQSWDTITAIGKKITAGWKSLASTHNLELDYWGLPALCGFTVKSKNALAYKTLITQEMLKKGMLAGTSVYACIEHKDSILNEYFEKLDPIFQSIRECEDGKDVISLLEGPICHSGFSRLN
ncbi:aminotransferase class III-fold pyridoxal phosphate-dependent enzyme [Leptospira sp. 201903070]|uniref:Aminotransferase class III-fold pyridoxal phosphate-dependent enzyme n=1 Tax=Leptospira ainlahdjerensis TaxID=2810033 RepID=A0ABS2UAE5_9LEPT|nr:aminotransferase class III-fold pyridoxal phosphate-dependent enzyme [Leptospira ainlahdjerensis]MBM9577341.1 aminotransferase class III-fold pyridoxal phosphate-dependent enzyme [Leptospira ainlahdjerensis]